MIGVVDLLLGLTEGDFLGGRGESAGDFQKVFKASQPNGQNGKSN